MKISIKLIAAIALIHFCVLRLSALAEETSENRHLLNGPAAEQLKTLDDHPELVFFKGQRAKAMNDRWYPQYHYLATDGFMGDPNGLSYWNGNWHLFYQYYKSNLPYAKDYDFPPHHKQGFWGHAVSPDLVHWTDLPVAFKTRYKTGRCFSGGALVESDRVLATYVNTGMGGEIAEARDPLLLNWTYLGNDPEVPALPFNAVRKDRVKVEHIADEYSVWDPCLFKRGDTYYLLGGGSKAYLPDRQDLFAKQQSRPKKPRWTITTTRDKAFKSWEYCGEFVDEEPFSRLYDDGSCNYFWSLGKDKDVLVYFSHQTGSHLMVGSFDEEAKKFLPISRRTINSGPASSTPDPENPEKMILISSHNTNRPGDSGWRIVYSLPRRYGLDERDELTVQPAGVTESLRGPVRALAGTPLTVAHGEQHVFDGIAGNAMELELEINPKQARTIYLDVLRSPNGKEFTRFALIKGGSPTPRKGGSRWTLRLDDARSGFGDGFQNKGPVSTEFFLFGNDKTFKLRVFLDVSIVEAFVNNRAHLVQRVHPVLPDSTGVSVHAVGGKIEVLSLKAWQMNSIWPQE